MSDDKPEITTLALMLGERLIERTQTHPLSTVAGATLAGWVLARGLPQTVLRMGMAAAVRVAGARVLQELSASTAEADEGASTNARAGSEGTGSSHISLM